MAPGAGGECTCWGVERDPTLLISMQGGQLTCPVQPGDQVHTGLEGRARDSLCPDNKSGREQALQRPSAEDRGQPVQRGHRAVLVTQAPALLGCRTWTPAGRGSLPTRKGKQHLLPWPV